MQNYHKYVTAGPDDLRWGLYVVDAGVNHVVHHTDNFRSEHPGPYQFTWSSGRILQEYQLIYLTAGSGVFETHYTPVQQVAAGSVMLLYPGVWHRYHPDVQTGWSSYWVGFRGAFIEHLVNEGFLDPRKPVVEIGYVDEIVRHFHEVLTLIKAERPGFQQVAGSSILQILGRIQAAVRNMPFEENSDIGRTIDRARVLFLESIGQPKTPKEVANELHLSYSWFRKMFKQYTGTSPGQYQLQLRIQRARELLSDPSRSIKEISYELGFNSQAHFTRTFTSRAGVTPGVFRRQAMGGRTRSPDLVKP